MDIKIQTKITVLLEKINYLNLSIQQSSEVSKVDKDLLTNYVRELYELVLSLPVQSQQAFYGQQPVYQQPMPEQPQYQQPPQGFYPPNASPIGNNPPINPQQQNYPQQNQVNGNQQPYTNGSPQQPQQQQPFSQPMNPAFSFSNGKRTISESIRIKTGDTEKASVNQQFRKDESHIAGKMQLTPIKDLKTFIGLNKRFSYINFLFGNDANMYDDAIEKLNNSGSKESAMDYLDNHLRPKLKWSDENDMVEEFYTLVERRYM